ncbi:DUF6422 family protein [Streptomyces sp. NPDC002773]|uniref:DUF6422 family protein n=1 Tax=Streptomyces sp. NPDC002773 TaxID=3154430 RepID=UPI003324FD71
MSYPTDGLSDEQVQALKEAARLVRHARVAAADMLTRSGIDPGPASAGIGALDICTARISPGTPIRTCGCPGFRGDSDFCFSQYQDFTGPDFGEGAIIRICGHPRKAHESL